MLSDAWILTLFCTFRCHQKRKTQKLIKLCRLLSTTAKDMWRNYILCTSTHTSLQATCSVWSAPAVCVNHLHLHLIVLLTGHMQCVYCTCSCSSSLWSHLLLLLQVHSGLLLRAKFHYARIQKIPFSRCFDLKTLQISEVNLKRIWIFFITCF